MKSKILAVVFHIPQKKKKKHVSINKKQIFKMSKMQKDMLKYFKKGRKSKQHPTYSQSHCLLVFLGLSRCFVCVHWSVRQLFSPRYEGLHYKHHSTPLPRQVCSLGCCCRGGKICTLPFGQDFFFLVELYTWQVLNAKRGSVTRNKREKLSHRVNSGFNAHGQVYLADSWRLYLSSGWHWPER